MPAQLELVFFYVSQTKLFKHPFKLCNQFTDSSFLNLYSKLRVFSKVLIAMADAAAAEPSKSALKKAEKAAKLAAQKAEKAAKQAAIPVVGGKKTDDIIGITVTKADNFPAWYQEVVLKAEMVEYYQEISGFFVLRPLSMHIWNTIRKWFSERIEAMGVEETSFPLFLSEKSLEKEKDHVEGFAPELAWVTKA